MKNIALLLVILFSAIQCKNKEAEKVENPKIETPVVNEIKLNNDCYVYDANGSKIILEITNSTNEISGNLDYQLKEKDSNKGTFKGTLTNDILLLNYIFQSEGKESSREIAFKVKDNQLIEGFGEIVTEGTNAKFKDVKTLDFSSTMPLTKTDCAK